MKMKEKKIDMKKKRIVRISVGNGLEKNKRLREEGRRLVQSMSERLSPIHEIVSTWAQRSKIY